VDVDMRDFLSNRWEDIKYSWVVYKIKNIWLGLKFAFIRWTEHHFPDWAWKKATSTEFPIIAFPTDVVFQEEEYDEEDGKYIGFRCVNPGSYHVLMIHPKNSHQPRRRALYDCLTVLSDFAMWDHINYFGEINIKFIFDDNLTDKQKAVIVVDSDDTREAREEDPEVAV
jgi:hypothetical protein